MMKYSNRIPFFSNFLRERETQADLAYRNDDYVHCSNRRKGKVAKHMIPKRHTMRNKNDWHKQGKKPA